MERKKACGAIYYNYSNYLDHLATLCSIMQIPLVVSEEEMYETAKKFYPKLEIILHSDYLSYYQFIATNFDVIISCQFLYSDEYTTSLLRSFNPNLKLVWLPHGNSDKAWNDQIFKALYKEKVAMVYGQHMLDGFKKHKVLNKIERKIIIGNYRFYYYQKNFEFYQNIFFKEIQNKLDSSKKTIFYAPTWDDNQSNSSYEKAICFLIERLTDFNLIVKPHPNSYIQKNYQLDKMHDYYEGHPNIVFVKNFPHLFPILEFCDLYLGDMSSVGYDFLRFDKPMVFLNNQKKSRKVPGFFLYSCGIEILPSKYKDIYNIIKKHLLDSKKFSAVRKKTYKYAFENKIDFELLKDTLIKGCLVD